MVFAAQLNSKTIAILAVASCLSAIAAWFMSRYAYRFGLVDIPNNRSSHTLPTPRGGGLGILFAFVVGAVSVPTPLMIWLPVAFLSLVSFFDDKLNLTARTRLLFQFVTACAVVFPLVVTSDASLLSRVVLIVFLLVFVVGTANFYNFMDGVNGIACLTGIVGFLLLAGHAAASMPDFSLLLLVVSLACMAFLPFNFPTAKVFMGDVGSILLGFFYAVSVVLLASSVAEFLAFCGCLFPFYADTLSTLYVRKRAGEKLSLAHRRHVYQLLANQLLIPHWQVSVGYAMLQALIGVICLQLLTKGLLPLALFLGGSFSTWCVIMTYVRKKTEV